MAASARGLANHSLYLARILLAAWRRDLADENVPALTLSQAYLPAARQHLESAYGWFLLAITRQEPLPERPPRNCADLPPSPAGKAKPAEIRECEQLERSGWLAAMLAADSSAPATPGGSPDNLAQGPAGTGPDELDSWLQALLALFDRMGDSLDEY